MILAALLLAGATGARPAEAVDLATWISSDDYPPSAMREGHEGTVAVSLTISETGSISDCVVTSSSGFAELDAQACRVLTERARFKPARDAEGKAITSHYSRQIAWRMPQDLIVAARDWYLAVKARRGPDGKIAQCEIETNGNPPVGVGRACEALLPDFFDNAAARFAVAPTLGMVVLETAFTTGPNEASMPYFTKNPSKGVWNRVAFEISETGNLENCHADPVATAAAGAENAAVCAMVPKKFMPPLDAAGKPQRLSGTYSLAISWR